MSKRRGKELFSQRDLAQFGVTARPRMPISPNTKLELQAQDPRSSEQKEQAANLEQKMRTLPMFAEEQVAPSAELARRRMVLTEATESCRQLLGILEMLKKAKGDVSHFMPVVMGQIAETERLLSQLSKSDR